MAGLSKSEDELRSIAQELADKGRSENWNLRREFRKRLDSRSGGRVRLLAACEAHGLAWLTQDSPRVFESCYRVLTHPDVRVAKKWFKQQGVKPMYMNAVLAGLKAWQRLASLAPDPETIEDLLVIQEALLSPKARKTHWATLVGLKIAALHLEASADEHRNMIKPSMGRQVLRGIKNKLQIVIRGNEQDYYVALALHRHLARLGRSNLLDINTGLHRAGQSP